MDVEGVRIELDLASAIDFAAERKRLEKDLAAAEDTRRQAETRLGDEKFTAKAPEAVIAKMRARAEQADQDIRRISDQLAAIPAS
jgi:valyl-tRNA synthetase